MPDSSIATTAFPVANSLAANDSFIVLHNNSGTTNTCLISVENALSNSVFDLTVAAGRSFAIAGSFTPANSSANGVTGTVTWDSSYLYVCVANNTWGRIALSKSPTW